MTSQVSSQVQSNFPQKGNNRTLAQIEQEIGQYVGGAANKSMKNRVKASVREAVRDYNSWMWTFNRTSQDITLVSTDPDYSLNSNFRSPLRSFLVDSDGKNREEVEYVPWRRWAILRPDESGTGSQPAIYTLFNPHAEGLVIVHPIPTAPLSYPTFRLRYHKRIVMPSSPSMKLDVPEEIEEGIFLKALALSTHKAKNSALKAAGEYRMAGDKRLELEQEYRDWPDIRRTR